MKYKICAIRDRAADGFMQPIFVASVGQALRSFQDEVNREDAQNALNKHPEDFDLYLLGEYDDAKGALIACDPEQLAIGKDCVIKGVR